MKDLLLAMIDAREEGEKRVAACEPSRQNGKPRTWVSDLADLYGSRGRAGPRSSTLVLTTSGHSSRSATGDTQVPAHRFSHPINLCIDGALS